MMQVVMSVDYVVTIICRRNRDRDRSKALKVILEVRSKVKGDISLFWSNIQIELYTRRALKMKF